MSAQLSQAAKTMLAAREAALKDPEAGWFAAQALDGCLTEIRKVAELGLGEESVDVMRATLRRILRLIGEPARIGYDCDCGCEDDWDTHNSIQEALARDAR